MNIYVGVYGRSDKTNIRVVTENSKLIGYSEVEEANIHLSIKHAWDAILRGIRHALRKSGINLHDTDHDFKIGLGLKYTELEESCIAFEKSAPKIFSKIILKSDGLVLCTASHKNNGSILILDEGMVGNAIHNNAHIKIGGWGFPHADCGSFPWIGMEAIRLTLQWKDGHIKASPLLEAIYAHFDNNVYDLVHWAMETRALPDEYLIICNIVLEYLKKDDVNSIKMIQKTAREANKIYKQLQLQSELPVMSVCLYGYLAPYVEPFLSEDIKNNISHPEQNGVNGAIRLVQ